MGIQVQNEELIMTPVFPQIFKGGDFVKLVDANQSIPDGPEGAQLELTPPLAARLANARLIPLQMQLEKLKLMTTPGFPFDPVALVETVQDTVLAYQRLLV
jgi:hypothetical protein